MTKKFNMKSKGNFNFGNKGNYDINTVTKDQSVSYSDPDVKKKAKELKKKSAVKNYKKGYYGA